MFGRKREDDLDRELRAHLDLEAEELGDRDAARRALGSVARIKEDVREAWGWPRVERAVQDFRYALRQMQRPAGFTIVAVFTLAMGLGAVTAIFSILNGVLLQPLRYREPGRLFLARTVPAARTNLQDNFPVNALWADRWRRYCRACEGTALAQFADLTLVGAGEPVKLAALNISLRIFSACWEWSPRWAAIFRRMRRRQTWSSPIRCGAAASAQIRRWSGARSNSTASCGP